MTTLPADIHLHSKLCGHASGELEQYIEHAIELGLAAMGFSFHLPVDIPVPYKVNVTRAELDTLVDQVARLRDAYAGQLPILLGGEADYLPAQEHQVAELAAAYPFDYLIGSVHFIDDWAFDHPAEVARYDDWDLADLYARYFALLRQAMATGLFDVVGHIDLVKKFGHRPSGDWSHLIRDVCAAARQHDLCVELNTAGFDKPVGEQYASAPILRACFQAGVPLAFGSDAHAPDQVGRHFTRAIGLARAAGYSSYATFAARRRTLAPLNEPSHD